MTEITKELIERDIKVLSQEQWTKQDVLREMQLIADHIKQKDKSQYLDKATIHKLIDYLVLTIEADGFCVSYDKRTKQGNPQTAIVLSNGKKKKYNLSHLHRFFSGTICKSFKQRLSEKYKKFMETRDKNNLTEWEQGYLTCLQQLMIPYKLIDAHDLYKKEEE